jgi:hypothetical protein
MWCGFAGCERPAFSLVFFHSALPIDRSAFFSTVTCSFIYLVIYFWGHDTGVVPRFPSSPILSVHRSLSFPSLPIHFVHLLIYYYFGVLMRMDE